MSSQVTTRDAKKRNANENAHRILAAYVRYDADPRVSGPDDYDAFFEAVQPLLEVAQPVRIAAPKARTPYEKSAYELGYCPVGEAWT